MTLVGSNYATACVVARRRKGRLEFLVMDTVRLEGRHKGIKLTQFPMGMAEPEDNGNPEKTLNAEVEEETGLSIKGHAKVNLLHFEQFGGNEHAKLFFLVWRSGFRGKIRTHEISDRRTLLGIPYWVNLEVLKAKLCESHRPVLEKLEALS
ncbi:MAG: NUDIX hydrolase [Candidatus Zambryskibacteria bacterium]|nr:NUDIX hydrolase [Candidatus Zambryskibacteria bacterium]